MTSAPSTSPPVTVDPTTWLDEYGDRLFAYAMARVRDRHLAEDLVQETLLAAIRNRETFEHRSALSTWLTGILRHRILDHERTMARRGTPQPIEHGDGFIEGFFDTTGKWKIEPDRWDTVPASAPEREEFWRARERCIGNLPARSADAIVLQAQEKSNEELAQPSWRYPAPGQDRPSCLSRVRVARRATRRRNLMLSCRKASERISAAQDGTLSFGGRLLMIFHLAICGPCRRYRLQVRRMQRALRRRFAEGDGSTEVALDPEARERIRRALSEAQ